LPLPLSASLFAQSGQELQPKSVRKNGTKYGAAQTRLDNHNDLSPTFSEAAE